MSRKRSSERHASRSGTTNEVRLTIAEHLEELRRRLGISLAVLVVCVGITMTQVDRVIGWLRRPAGIDLPRFAYFSPTEPIIAYVKVGCLSGLVLAMPVILWQLWGFVRSGLTWRERYYGVAFVWWGSVHFLGGVAFAYYILLPASLRFLLGIGQRYLEPVISIDRYLSFVTALMVSCGFVFELPILLCILVKIGIVTPEWLRQQRPYAMLILVIAAALITPTTDPVNLMLLALPMIFLYELSILMAGFAVPRTRHSREKASH